MGEWRVGNHYKIHVYEASRPVATFHTAADAACCVEAVNRDVNLHHRLGHASLLLQEARAQIAYLHEKFQPTGSGEAVKYRIDAFLKDCAPAEGT